MGKYGEGSRPLFCRVLLFVLVVCMYGCGRGPCVRPGTVETSQIKCPTNYIKLFKAI